MTYIRPLLLLFLCLSAAGALRSQSHRRSRLLIVGLLGLFLLSWPPAEWLFSRPLEWSYPIRPFTPDLSAQAIVVLGGGIDAPSKARPYALPDRSTFVNCTMAAWIHEKAPALPVLACEGSHGSRVFPSLMPALLKNAGVPESAIWLEVRSHNTHENAVYGASILNTHGIRRIILVTDAQSMPRAAACFRKLGFAVDPAPSEYGQLSFSDLIPDSRAIWRNNRTLHEVLGLAWYQLHNWI